MPVTKLIDPTIQTLRASREHNHLSLHICRYPSMHNLAPALFTPWNVLIFFFFATIIIRYVYAKLVWNPTSVFAGCTLRHQPAERPCSGLMCQERWGKSDNCRTGGFSESGRQLSALCHGPTTSPDITCL